MKITRIYLKNLNSLRGEFTINLEEEPFANTGIFAITGPTGAGKSTILDAITLALYGRAARYDNKPNPENMMSRGTGECQAEVEFEVSKGRYRASWQMKRARGKPDGKLQPVSRYVYDSQNLPIAQTVSEANKTIEELTGLDVDRFFRSVLLAQGDFVKFLKATPNERATLLESLTGTGIYTEISKKVHEETSSREQQLKHEESKLGAIKLLTQAEQADLLQRQGELQKEIEQNMHKFKELERLISLGKDVENRLKQKNELKKQQESLQQEIKSLQIDFDRLKLFKQGESFYSQLHELDETIKSCFSKRKEMESAENSVKTGKLTLRAATDAAQELIFKSLNDLETAILELSKKKHQKALELESLKAWLDIHHEDQILDNQLSYLVEQLTTLTHQREKSKELQKEQSLLLQNLEGNQKQAKSFLLKKEKAVIELQQIQQTIQDNEKKSLELLQGKTIEQIKSEITSITEQLSLIEKWEETNSQIQVLTLAIQQLSPEIEKSEQAMNLAEHQLQLVSDKIKVLKQQIDNTRLVASLQEHRERLKPGHACPLCGSLDHPFVQGKDHSFSAISDFENQLKILEAKAFQKNNDVKNCISQSARTQETLKHKKQELKNASEKLETFKTIFQTHRDSDFQWMNKDLEKITLHENLSSLRSLLKNIEAEEKLKLETNKIFFEVQNKVALAQNNLDSIEKQIQNSMERLETIKVSLDRTKKEVESCEISLLKDLERFNLKLPIDGEEKKLKVSLEERKNTYQNNRKSSDKLITELNNFQSDLQRLDERRKQLEGQYQSLKEFVELHEIASIKSLAHEKNAFEIRWSIFDEAFVELRRLENALTKLKTILSTSKDSLQEMQNRQSEIKIKLSEELLVSPFKTIEGLRLAQLAPEETARIENQKREMENRSMKLSGQLEQIDNELTRLLNENVPQGELLIEMQQDYQDMNHTLKEKDKEFVLIQKALQDDERNHQEHSTKLALLIQDRKRLSIWQKLSHLIGSYDGKAFRKFAQGLSLDLLIKCANNHLSLLNNRYKLKRIEGEELDLEIQDLYQANATRPTTSLSGGESFLTSLGLALGLSDLAGKNVRIDSLFIDEGFGSLDSETLEIAVQALESLRSKNKNIGVISHIELLKERIPTQIVVEKGSGGISTMRFSA